MHDVARILVVDDDALVRELLAEALTPLAAEVVEAGNVEEAEARIAQEPPDLILLDVGLPRLSGYEFCRRLRAADATATVPVVMVTGLCGPEQHLLALEAGATDFIAKPFGLHEVYVRARNLLALHRTQRQLNKLLEAEALKTRRQRARIEKYLAPSIVSRILDVGERQAESALGDTFRCHAVVLFADLRGYTGLAETLEPATLVSMLNVFFETVVSIAHRHEGTTISMAGDCLMVAFGVPHKQHHPVQRAIATALQSLERFAVEVDEWQARHGVHVGMGIGISEGEVVAGNIGAHDYMNFTLVGDVVNVAARLTARARAGEILMTANVGPSALSYCERIIVLPEVHLKGKSGPVSVWCVPAAARLEP